MFIDITEPEKKEITRDNSKIIGIDFGTTNSLVAYCDENGARIIPDASGKLYLPSIVSYGRDNISSVKRLFGRSFEEIKSGNFVSNLLKTKIKNSNNNIVISTEKGEVFPVEVASQIFKQLKSNAENYLKTEVTKAVVTVPAYFDDASKSMIRDSARLAGLDIVRLVAEPTAAAYAYGLENRSEGNYLVFDIGGGTFDVSVLSMRMGAFQVLAIGGDPLLGGDDIDIAIGTYLKNKYNLSVLPAKEEEFLKLCRKIKESDDDFNRHTALDTWSTFLLAFQKGDDDLNDIRLSKEEFEELILSVIRPSISIAKKTAIASGVEKFDGIILVGGSTRLKLIKKLLLATFPGVPIKEDIDPDQAVAIGASMQGWNLSSKKGDVLIDAVPLSLGIELMGGVVEKIISRNTPIPASVTQEYTSYADNQTGFDLHIVQGDREMAADCRSLAKLKIKDIPPMIAGKAILEVTFTVDADGLLTVSALEKNTNVKQIVEIKPTYGLSDQNLLNMLKEAMDNAEVDYNKSRKATKIIEINSIVSRLKSLIEKNKHMLKDDEYNSIEARVNNIESIIDSAEYQQLSDSLEDLKKESESFVEKFISEEIGAYLKGKKID